MFIYKVTNLVNGKIYIGKDSKNKKNYFGSGILIKKAIEKYGKENFKKEIIEYCKNGKELNDKETFWIKKLKSYNLSIGYNLTFGGDGFSHGILNPVHNPEVKEKIIKKLKINNGSFRPEVREKMRKAMKDRPLSQEHKNAISKGLKGHCASKGADNPSSKEWIVIFPDGHKETIKGLRSFCRKYNLNAKLMRKTAKGIFKQHKGYILKEKYKNESTN